MTSKRSLMTILGLGALALAAFWPVLGHPFLEYDDDEYVTQNVQVRRGLGADSLAWALTSVGYASNWHPLTWISHMLDVQLFGLHPQGHHFTSLLLHAATAGTLFVALQALTGAFARSALVAAVWAAHPLLVESVARISQRKDLLSGLLWMLTILAYGRYARRPQPRSYLTLLLTYCLGLLSKPTAVSLPFVLWLLDYWPLGTWNRPVGSGGSQRRSGLLALRTLWIVDKIPLLALSAITSLMTYAAQERGGMMATFQRFALHERIANALWSYAAYIGKLVWPVRLSPLYPHLGGDLSLFTVLQALAFLAIATGLAAVTARRRPHLAVGWCWYLGALLPMIGIVQVGVQGMADRYMYLPSIGLLVLISWSVNAEAWGRAGQRIALILTAALLAGLVTSSRVQAKYWASDLALYRRAVTVTSRNWLAEYNVGVYLEREGRLQEARRNYEASLRIFPGNSSAHNNLGALLARQGEYREAVAHFRLAAGIEPRSATVQYNLANALLQQGRLGEAIEHYEQAVRLNPMHGDAYTNLGAALLAAGRIGQAVDCYRQVVRLSPDSAEARHHLGWALEMAGKDAEALPEYRQSLRLKSDHSRAREGIARIMARRGVTHEAGALAAGRATGQRAVDRAARRGLPSSRSRDAAAGTQEERRR